MSSLILFYFFFFNDTATTEIYTLSLHDALPISPLECVERYKSEHGEFKDIKMTYAGRLDPLDRKSTRLNSSHGSISYAVFCLKKKKRKQTATQRTVNHQESNTMT